MKTGVKKQIELKWFDVVGLTWRGVIGILKILHSGLFRFSVLAHAVMKEVFVFSVHMFLEVTFCYPISVVFLGGIEKLFSKALRWIKTKDVWDKNPFVA